MKIFYNLPLFAKYLVIYHFFETQFCGNWVFMVLEFIKLEYNEKVLKFFYVTWVHELMNSSYFKNFKKNSWYELEYYGKFDFHKIEFQKSSRLLNIS